MKKKAFKRKRNILNVLAVLVMLMATLLTACSSSKTDAVPASEETSAAEADKEAEQVKEEAAEPEPTAEPTPEPTPGAVVYEGIDMESTLPGAEWMETFNGIIEEPKFVIFNDETNKKVILENGQEAEISSTDTFSRYYPIDKEIVVGDLKDNTLFCDIDIAGRFKLYSDLFPGYKEGDKVEVSQVIWVDGEEMELKVTLVIKNN